MSLIESAATLEGVSTAPIPGFFIREASRLEVILVENGSVDNPLDAKNGIRVDPPIPEFPPINIGLLVIPKHLRKRWRMISEILIGKPNQGGSSCDFESFAQQIVSFLSNKGLVGDHPVSCNILLCTAATGSIQQPSGLIEASTEHLGSSIWINMGENPAGVQLIESGRSRSPSYGNPIRMIRIGIPPFHGIKLSSTIDLKGFDPLDQPQGVFLQAAW